VYASTSTSSGSVGSHVGDDIQVYAAPMPQAGLGMGGAGHGPYVAHSNYMNPTPSDYPHVHGGSVAGGYAHVPGIGSVAGGYAHVPGISFVPISFVPVGSVPIGSVPGSYAPGRYAPASYAPGRYAPASYAHDDNEGRTRCAEDGRKTRRRDFYVECPNPRYWNQYLAQSLSYDDKMRRKVDASYAAMVAASVFLTIMVRVIDWFRKQLDGMIKVVERP
jgi:hypothetical protein